MVQAERAHELLTQLNATMVQVREGGGTCLITNAFYLPDLREGVRMGIWIHQTEGAEFCLKVMNELKLRSLGDILIAVVDGIKGFREAITTVFPQALVQSCG